MGNGLVRYKAEIDFDGRELARSYIERYPNHILGRSYNLLFFLIALFLARFTPYIFTIHQMYHRWYNVSD